MRNFILTALLASSVAMPAMAQDHGNRDRHGRGGNNDSEQQSPQRQVRTAPPQRAESSTPQARQRPSQSDAGQYRQRTVRQPHEPAFQQPALRHEGQRRAWTQRRQDRTDAIQSRHNVPTTNVDGATIERQRYTRTRDGTRTRGSYDQNRTSSSNWTSTNRSSPRYSGSNRQWSNQWRTNRNYDWRRYRDSNRSLYRLGRYNDPYGSRYRRFSIGFSLFPSYYQSSYWLDDPYMYRLPQAYGPYRWVRYYGDALLVNTYTGQVVDVVYDFFW